MDITVQCACRCSWCNSWLQTVGFNESSCHLLLAKATCGHEIDPSEGRQLRKRPDPPKVEKKTPARKPYSVSE